MKTFEQMTEKEIREKLIAFESLMTLIKEEHELREARAEYLGEPEDNEDYRYLTDELSYRVYCIDEILEEYNR